MSKIARSSLVLLSLALAVVTLPTLPATAQSTSTTELLRFPDLHGDTVAFVYAGDIWVASDDGGLARRVTSHPGLELFPKFSPDGQWIAFTGQYEGDEQVYVVPTAGGAPQQLTYYPAEGPLPPRWGYDHQVYGWTPEGDGVLFRSMRYGFDLTDTQLFTVSVEGGLPVPLPMPVSGAGDFSPDGTKMIYTPLTRDFRSWKRYAGGWAQDLWIFDLETYDTTRVTDDARSDRDPMWIGDKVYFASDRDGTLNLYSYDTASGATEKLTDSTVWDVRWPSASPDGRIVYELDGELEIFDLASNGSRRLAIQVPTDALPTRPEHISVAANIESMDLSPKGERALLVARGDVFTVPIENGPIRNLTHSSDAHDKGAAWSPDGRTIAFISDMSGEEEIYLVEQNGRGEPRRLTRGHDRMLFTPEWSPDGDMLAFSDKTGKLFAVDVESGDERVVVESRGGIIGDYTWSPHGGHLAFSLPDPSGFSSIYVWSRGDGEVHRLTGELWNEYSPTWDPSGDFLYYLSDRGFAPQIGSFEWNYVVDRETGIYAMALREDVENPFPLESDEVTIEGEDDEDGEGDDDADADEEQEADSDDDGEEDAESEEAHIRIDFEGISDRVVKIPVELENYYALAAVPGHLVFVPGGAFYYGRGPDVPFTIKLYSIEDEKQIDYVSGAIQNFALSADGKKMLLQRGGSNLELLDIAPGGADSAKKLDLGNLSVLRDPRQEWGQIFDEVWRRFRDYFYVENLHGYDWEALRERYRPLLAHVGHRSDLNYVISEMIGELNVGHAYITGGDYEIPERPSVALPGARFELDESSNRYRLAEIYPGQNEEDKYRSPLRQLGVDASPGDYVLAIDGVEIDGSDNPYRELRYKADRQVALTVNSRPSMDGAREVVYEPITEENSLIYLDWITDNRRKVTEMSDGRLGYLHIPDMGPDGIYEFIKHFYGQLRKDGMVIDVRNNGGGNVSAMIIERLRRELLAMTYPRDVDYVSPYPNQVFHGHLVCLMNENSASDGDIFPAMFKAADLGPVIGKRSWGGVIGITNRGTLIDGGGVNVPEFGFVSPEGDWIIEGYGVEPDIVVENDPKSLIEGRDPQLERGVEMLLQMIREDPRELAAPAPDPVRTEEALREQP